jgi:hypothetical protein
MVRELTTKRFWRGRLAMAEFVCIRRHLWLFASIDF